ncbi:predicted protein [Histoplasma capsulatum var. duboisii H88]|uniref:Predicted protein n=1 Tax=Ajellomyces capsulatus (strain H88) TaxID=544711 RepID=F0U7H5_AJEC8|nr:predicted protein [Histoplasma capsulatum var. duboisii H88]
MSLVSSGVAPVGNEMSPVRLIATDNWSLLRQLMTFVQDARCQMPNVREGGIAMSAEQSVDGIGLVYLIDFEAAQRSYFGVDILLVKYGQTSGCDMGFNTFIKQDTLG